MRVVLAFVVASATSAPAAAEPDPGDATALYLIMGGGLGGLTGPLAIEWSVDTGLTEVGAGLRHRRVEVTVGLGSHFLDSNQVRRDTADLVGLSYGGDLGYHLGLSTGVDLFARVGWRWRRMWGDTPRPVRRDCDVTRDCAGGFYHDTIGYSVHGPTAAIGGERSWIRRRAWLGVRAQLEALGMIAELPGARSPGMYVGVRVDLLIGRTLDHARVATTNFR